MAILFSNLRAIFPRTRRRTRDLRVALDIGIIRGQLESKGCPVLRALPRYFHCCSTNLKRNWRAIAREAVARNEIIYNLGRFRTLTQV